MLNDLKNKKLIVLGGNPYACEIGNFCHNHHIEVLSISNDKNARIHNIAQKSFIHDSTDLYFLTNLVNKEHVDGIYMGGNETVISKVCNHVLGLGLPCYCTPSQWSFFQNKVLFKKLCSDAGLPVLKRYDYAPNKKCDISFPVITKPSDGCGSSGFSLCYNYDELEKGYAKALHESSSGEVVVEDYVNNKGHVVFYSFSNGVPHFCQLHDKYPVRIKKDGSFIAGLHIVPSQFTDEFVSLFGKKLDKMFRQIGVREGTIWIEVFHDGDNYYFNEAGFRYGGSSSIFPIDYFTGINQIAADIYYCLTGKSMLFGFESSIESRVAKGKKHYCMLPLHSIPGTISELSVDHRLYESNNICKVIIKKDKNSNVPDTGDFSQNIGYIHFVYDNRKEFMSTIALIKDSLLVKNTNNEDMLIFQSEEFYLKVKVD